MVDGKLKWQCRRGIKEVEVLLEPFFLRFYEELDDYHQESFRLVLGCQDADLFEWFTERTEPEDERLKEMVNVILEKLAT